MVKNKSFLRLSAAIHKQYRILKGTEMTGFLRKAVSKAEEVYMEAKSKAGVAAISTALAVSSLAYAQERPREVRTAGPAYQTGSQFENAGQLPIARYGHQAFMNPGYHPLAVQGGTVISGSVLTGSAAASVDIYFPQGTPKPKEIKLDEERAEQIIKGLLDRYGEENFDLAPGQKIYISNFTHSDGTQVDFLVPKRKDRNGRELQPVVIRVAAKGKKIKGDPFQEKFGQDDFEAERAKYEGLGFRYVGISVEKDMTEGDVARLFVARAEPALKPDVDIAGAHTRYGYDIKDAGDAGSVVIKK